MKRLVRGVAAVLLVSTAAVMGAEASPAAAAQPVQSSVAHVAPVTMSRSSVNARARNLNYHWSRWFRSHRIKYYTPKVAYGNRTASVRYRGAVLRSSWPVAYGTYPTPIILVQGNQLAMFRRVMAGGDTFVIAHEYGHAVNTMITRQYNRRGSTGFKQEKAAACYAGAYYRKARHALPQQLLWLLGCFILCYKSKYSAAQTMPGSPL